MKNFRVFLRILNKRSSSNCYCLTPWGKVKLISKSRTPPNPLNSGKYGKHYLGDISCMCLDNPSSVGLIKIALAAFYKSMILFIGARKFSLRSLCQHFPNSLRFNLVGIIYGNWFISECYLRPFSDKLRDIWNNSTKLRDRYRSSSL